MTRQAASIGSALRKNPESLVIHRRPDGAISRDVAERLALFLADDLELPAAWRLLGKKNDGGSLTYRHALVAHPVFVARLAELKAEKEALMSDALFGETKWMVQQMWREARATANASMMQKAVELRMKILDKETELVGAVPGGKPGKPSVENPQTSAGMEDIKARLQAIGVAPQPEAPSNEVEKSDMPRVATPVPHETVVFPEPPVDIEAMLARVG